MNRKNNFSTMAKIAILREKKFALFLCLFCGILMSLVLGFGIRPSDLAFAQSANGFSMTVEAGFDGKIKDGQWIPVRIILENQGDDLDGLLRIELSDGSAGMDTTEYPIDLPSISKKEVVVNIYPGGIRPHNTSFTHFRQENTG